VNPPVVLPGGSHPPLAYVCVDLYRVRYRCAMPEQLYFPGIAQSNINVV